MGSDRTRNSLPDGVLGARPSHGRTCGPTRRSTKGQWTAEEDEILSMAVRRFEGKNWKKIAKCFKDRTDVQCLHRWQKVLNPELVKGPWSKDEDKIIVESVNKHGPKKWSTIAQHLPGRSGKQCRERWHNHLNPIINNEAWTQNEELILIRVHKIYGNKWAELTKYLPGRSDNAIKNRWNSSVKKKLDVYLASGLLSHFQGPPMINQSSHTVASSSSKAQQSSADYRDVAELEEASECSQGAVNRGELSRGDYKATEEPSPIPCSKDNEDTYPVQEVPCELNDKFLEHVLSLDWNTFAGKDWKPSTNELPDTLESSGQFMQSLTGRDNQEAITFPENDYIESGTSTSMINTVACSDTSNLKANSDCERVLSEGDHDFDGHADLLLNDCSNYQMSYAMSDFPTEDCPISFGINPDQYECSSLVNAEQESVLPTSHDDFIYIKDSDCFSCEGNTDEARTSPKLVLSSDSQCCPSKEKCPVVSDDRKDIGALFYEPHRFPSSDLPFFSCDLIQSSNDMHQEFSPLGIRQKKDPLP